MSEARNVTDEPKRRHPQLASSIPASILRTGSGPARTACCKPPGIGKVTIVGAKDRTIKQLKAKVVKNTDRATTHDFVADAAKPEATVYTDGAATYEGDPTRTKRSSAFSVRIYGTWHTPMGSDFS